MTLSRSALVFFFLSTAAQAEGTDWRVRTARMEGAAANIEEAIGLFSLFITNYYITFKKSRIGISSFRSTHVR